MGRRRSTKGRLSDPPREQGKDVSQEESLWEGLDVDGGMLFRAI